MLGDKNAKKLMVVYGDSHTIMWLPAYEDIASQQHYRLIVFVKYFCPATDVSVVNPPGSGNIGGRYRSCDRWHRWVTKEINALHPELAVLSQDSLYKTPISVSGPSEFFTPAEWKQGTERALTGITDPGTKKVVLGNIPMLPQSGPVCLAAHQSEVQACTGNRSASCPALVDAERVGTEAAGGQYIDPTSWFCSSVCTAIVGHYGVYLDGFHVTGTYAKYLELVLADALGFRT